MFPGTNLNKKKESQNNGAGTSGYYLVLRHYFPCIRALMTAHYIQFHHCLLLFLRMCSLHTFNYYFGYQIKTE